MAYGVKTNERPGTRAQVRYSRVSAYKAREVLDLIRGRHVSEADEILRFVERDVAIVIRKCLASAVANALTNDGQDPDTLFVSACFADEGPTLKRWRPRARGRATRIRKRTCHITVIVSRLPEADLRRWQDRQAASAPAGRTRRRGGAVADRRARVARSRQKETAVTEDEPTSPVPGEPTEDTIAAAEEADEETATDAGAGEGTGAGAGGDELAESSELAMPAEAEIALQDADAEADEAGADEQEVDQSEEDR